MSVKPDGAVALLGFLFPPWGSRPEFPASPRLGSIRRLDPSRKDELLCLLIEAIEELDARISSTERPITESTCAPTCAAGEPSSGRKRPMTGAERARRYREKKARGE